MYKTPKFRQTSAKRNESVEGESLEMKIDRFVNNKEPMDDNGSEKIYMERKEGVSAAYNIRTDRFEIAVEAMDKVTKSYAAKREEKAKISESDSAEPTQATT